MASPTWGAGEEEESAIPGLSQEECSYIIALNGRFQNAILKVTSGFGESVDELKLPELIANHELLTAFSEEEFHLLNSLQGEDVMEMWAQMTQLTALKLSIAAEFPIGNIETSPMGHQRIPILGIKGINSLGDFAADAEAIGRNVAYSPYLLAKQDAAGASVVGDKTIYLSHEAFRLMIATHVEEHEFGHGYLDHLAEKGISTIYHAFVETLDPRLPICADYPGCGTRETALSIGEKLELGLSGGYSTLMSFSELYTFGITMRELAGELKAAKTFEDRKKAVRTILSHARSYHQIAWQSKALTLKLAKALQTGKGISNALWVDPNDSDSAYLILGIEKMRFAYEVITAEEKRFFHILRSLTPESELDEANTQMHDWVYARLSAQYTLAATELQLVDKIIASAISLEANLTDNGEASRLYTLLLRTFEEAEKHLPPSPRSKN